MRLHEAWDLMLGGAKMVVPGLLEKCGTNDAYFFVVADELMIYNGKRSVHCKDIPVYVALSNHWTEKKEIIYREIDCLEFEEFLKWKAEREAKQ